jgi:hypothetical protein
VRTVDLKAGDELWIGGVFVVVQSAVQCTHNRKPCVRITGMTRDGPQELWLEPGPVLEWETDAE